VTSYRGITVRWRQRSELLRDLSVPSVHAPCDGKHTCGSERNQKPNQMPSREI
jgi:hypothetical protein